MQSSLKTCRGQLKVCNCYLYAFLQRVFFDHAELIFGQKSQNLIIPLSKVAKEKKKRYTS